MGADIVKAERVPTLAQISFTAEPGTLGRKLANESLIASTEAVLGELPLIIEAALKHDPGTNRIDIVNINTGVLEWKGSGKPNFIEQQERLRELQKMMRVAATAYNYSIPNAMKRITQGGYAPLVEHRATEMENHDLVGTIIVAVNLAKPVMIIGKRDPSTTIPVRSEPPILFTHQHALAA